MLKGILHICSIFFFMSAICAQNSVNEKIQITKQTKRIALVIGNGNYGAIGKLNNTANDAKAIAKELEKTGFEVTLGVDLKKNELISYFYDFKEKLEKINPGVGLFYFGGHGIQFKEENYLLPIDAFIEKEQDIELESLSLSRVIGEMSYTNQSLNLIIIDACRKNSLKERLKHPINDGLASILPPMFTYLIYSTKPGGLTNDGEKEHGFYATAFAQFLAIPDLSFVDFLKKVRKTVYEETNKLQVPWDNGSLTFEFYFNKVN